MLKTGSMTDAELTFIAAKMMCAMFVQQRHRLGLACAQAVSGGFCPATQVAVQEHHPVVRSSRFPGVTFQRIVGTFLVELLVFILFLVGICVIV